MKEDELSAYWVVRKEQESRGGTLAEKQVGD